MDQTADEYKHELARKHNLKSVPFSIIQQGDTFYTLDIVDIKTRIRHLQRRLVGNRIPFTEGISNDGLPAKYIANRNVYVPVWRPTEK